MSFICVSQNYNVVLFIYTVQLNLRPFHFLRLCIVTSTVICFLDLRTRRFVITFSMCDLNLTNWYYAVSAKIFISEVNMWNNVESSYVLHIKSRFGVRLRIVL